MGRLLVGLDVDGVLYRWGQSVRRAIRDRWGVYVPYDEWFGEEHVTAEIWRWTWSDEAVRDIYGNGDSFPGAVRAARELCDKYDVRILTACPPAAHEVRERWLKRRNINYTELAFVATPVSASGIGTDGKQHALKSSVLPHCDIYIDDNARNLDELAVNTRAKKLLLVDHSWNRTGEVPKSRSKRIIRTYTWDDILREVEEVARDAG